MSALLAQRATKADLARALGHEPYASCAHGDRSNLLRLVAGWNQKLNGIEQEANRSNGSAVYLVGDMVHVAFTDESAHLRAYACVGN
jgi:hypothetical protein